MSYILDALRRADAERERGRVPGINAQPLPVPDVEESGGSGLRLWLLLTAAVAVMLAAALGWMWLQRGEAAQPPTAQGAVVPAPAGAATAVTPTPSASTLRAPALAVSEPVRPMAAERPREGGAALHPQRPARPTVRQEAAAAREERVAMPSADRTEPARSGAASSAVAARPVAASGSAAPATDAPRVYKIAELPDEIRRGMPKLSVGGSVYSPNPTARLVILNGQVLREGDQVQAGVFVEQIHAHDAVLSYRGYRYELPF